MHLPEELVHAAGMLPVMMWRSNELITLGHSRILPFNCGLSRSVVDDALKGKLDFMDGMVFYDTCLQPTGLPLIISSPSTFRPGTNSIGILPSDKGFKAFSKAL